MITEYDAARIESLADQGCDTGEIWRMTGFEPEVIRAITGAPLPRYEVKQRQKDAMTKLLLANPLHTPESLAPIFRRL
jgi:hypothetical protein